MLYVEVIWCLSVQSWNVYCTFVNTPGQCVPASPPPPPPPPPANVPPPPPSPPKSPPPPSPPSPSPPPPDSSCAGPMPTPADSTSPLVLTPFVKCQFRIAETMLHLTKFC
eukprot:jgi/Botrbrau1/6835/Bobra.0153s0030.1